MNPNEHQVKAITSLSREKRYRHFIKIIADTEELWALSESLSDDKLVYYMWPNKIYVENYLKNKNLTSVKPVKIKLNKFLNDVFPQLYLCAADLIIFPITNDDEYRVPPPLFEKDILSELDNY